MSELGFAYFFVRIDAKNAVKVYLVSPSCDRLASLYLHQEHGHLLEQFQPWYALQLERTIAVFVSTCRVSKLRSYPSEISYIQVEKIIWS
jgi:hypothetical protein